MKTVYVVMNAEFVHPGHINIIQVARALGEVTVGIATDEFAARYKRLPLMSYEQRKIIIENIQGVKRVIPQDTLNLAIVLRELKPDYFVHGDDWKVGRLSLVRAQVIEVMKEWGGQLIEPPYTEGISSTQLNAALGTVNLPENRLNRFRRLLTYQPMLQIIEVYDGLSASIIEQVQSHAKGFDAICMSFGDTALLGKPFLKSGGNTFRVEILEVLAIITKPLLVEMHFPTFLNHFAETIQTLERLGVSGVLVEASNESLPLLLEQIASGKSAQTSNDFSILVQFKASVVLQDADQYIANLQDFIVAGVDAMVLQVEAEMLDGTLAFCHRYAQLSPSLPLLLSLQNFLWETTSWTERGIRGLIYRNVLFQAAKISMEQAATTLLAQISPTLTG